MALTIVTGAAGSGKTESIFKNLIKSSLAYPERKYIIIAPEQATLQIEKRIIAMHPGHVLFNIDVLSFNRLAYRIFDLCEMASPVIIDEIGKSILLRSILKEQAESLTIYKKAAEKNGFTRKLKTMISELLMYGVTPEELKKNAATPDKMGDSLREKLADISLILERFIASHDEHNITAEELLPRALKLLPESGLFKDAYVVLEGFSGFTPIQYKYIEEMLEKSEDVQISLTIPTGENPASKVVPGELFALTKRTYQTLIDTASNAGKIVNTVPHGDDSGVPKPEVLSHLSASVFRGTASTLSLATDAPLKVYSCLNPAEEAEFAVHEIRRLVREEGFRYRDFAVVSDNLSGIDYVIKDVFNKADIPCYIDAKSDVMGHPLVVLTLAALEAAEKSFSMESVMRYLRSGLVPATFSEIDELENYALAIGAKSIGKWKGKWDKIPYKWQGEIDFDRLNEIKDRALTALFNFKDVYQSAKLVSDRVRSLRDLLEALEVQQVLDNMSQKFEEENDIIKALEYNQIFEKLSHILDEYEKLLGDNKIKKDEFRNVLSSGLEELKLGVLPAKLDEVHVGDVRRSRRGYVKVLFFIDFNEGIVPASPSGGGIFSDSDRDALSNYGIELAPSALQNILDEQLYVYELLSAPTKYLYIISARTDMSNKPLKPSSYLQKITECFDGLKTAFPEFGVDNIELGFEGLYYLVKGLQGGSKGNLKGLKDIVGSLRANGFSKNVEKIFTGSLSRYEGTVLSEQAVNILYGNTYFGSVSRLELQAKCAYAHFLRFGLKLKEREEHEFTTIDLGNFSHKVFQTLFDEIKAKGLNVKNVSATDRESVISKAIAVAEESVHGADYTEGEGNGENLYRLDRAKKTAKKVANVLLDMAAANDDSPALCEYEFKTSPYELFDDKKLVLNGKVDRYDISGGETPKIKVYDYKASDKQLKDELISAGIQLQLLEYLNVVLEKEQRLNEKVIADGAYYIISDDKMVTGDSPDFVPAGELVAEYKPKGISLSDKDSSRLNSMRKKAKSGIISKASEIMKGEISVSPYNQEISCKYCEFKDACGFDKNIPGFEYKEDKMVKEVKNAESDN